MEINPLHNGHLYFLEQVKKIANGNPIACIISTNIVQRGELSVLDKQTKTKLLLDNGVDFVFELPAVLANQGGQHFAYHAVNILNQFGITDLVFGSETADVDKLKTSAFDIMQLDYKQGKNKSLDILQSNDILGISYIRAINEINPQINVHPVKRIANNYNDEDLTSSISSATAIRKNIQDQSLLAKVMPEDSLQALLTIDEKLLFELFKVNLYNAIDNQFKIFLSEQNQLLYRLETFVSEANSLEHLANLAKDKNNSKYKYQRVIINTILFVEDQNYSSDQYLRILGFNRKYSHLIKGSFTSLANRDDQISIIEKRASRLFTTITKENRFDEFNRKPIIKEN